MKVTVEVIARCTTQRRRRDEKDEAFLRRLTHVNLSDKKLDRIDGLERCQNLVCLYLYENRISKIENLDFALNLTHLYIQDNNITVMENFEPLRNLQKLFIGGNAIQVITGLDGCNQLQELHVQAQRLPAGQPLQFDPASIDAIAESLGVLNTQKNNLTDASIFAPLQFLERLDLSMNHITTFEQVGALFEEGGCMSMQVLDMKGNPVDKQHKLRDYIVLMSPTLAVLNGREITETERQFLVNREAAKARRRQRELGGLDLNPMAVGGGGMGGYGPPEGVAGTLLMESRDDDPVAQRRAARPHVDAIPRKGAATAPAEREAYTGNELGGGMDREEEKRRLQQQMQFEGDVPVVKPRTENDGRPPPAGDAAEFSRVAREIEERREFLDEMRSAGRGGEYDAMVKAQIAEKVKELEILDSKLEDQAASALANPEPEPAPE